MPIFKYTLRKYLAAPSTWIVLAFSAIGVGFILGGMVPFVFVNLGSKELVRNYLRAVIGTVSGVTIFMAIFASVFSGFKSATLYKDEVENGVFLTLLSKPVKRSRIIFEKWLALIVVLIGYSFISVLFYCVSVSIFDIGDTLLDDISLFGANPLRDDIFRLGGLIFIIVFISGLIFSSLGILLSVRLSTGTTIGTMIAIGVFIPITSLFGAFLRNDSVRTFTNSNFLISTTQAKNTVSKLKGEVATQFARAVPTTTIGGISSADFQKAIIKQIDISLFPTLPSRISSFQNEISTNRFPFIGENIGGTDNYEKLFWMDLNYQYSKMAEFVYEDAIPGELREVVSFSGSNSFLTPRKVNNLGLVSVNNLVNLSNEFLKSYSPIASAAFQGLDFSFLSRFNFYGINTSGLVNPLPTPTPIATKVSIDRKLFERFANAVVMASSANAQNSANATMRQTFLDLKSALESAVTDPDDVARMLVSTESIVDAFSLVSMLPTPKQLVSAISDPANIAKFAQSLLTNNFEPLEFLTDLENFDVTELTYLSKSEPVADTWIGFRQVLTQILTDFLYLYGANLIDADDQKFVYQILEQRNAQLAPLSSQVFFADRLRTFNNNHSNSISYSIDELLRLFGNQKIYLSKKDAAVFSTLYFAADNDLLSKYSYSDYASKDSLIIAYVLIALILVPLTYPVIKRQDFR